MEREWKYSISERKFWKLVGKVSRFYDRQIDVAGYVVTLLEERPGIQIAEAYRILSEGNGKSKPYCNRFKEGDIVSNYRIKRHSRWNKPTIR